MSDAAARASKWTVEMGLTEVNPRLFELLCGMPVDPPTPPKHVIEFTDEGGTTHQLEGTLKASIMTPEEAETATGRSELIHQYHMDDGVYLCGPHDLNGNHIVTSQTDGQVS